MFENKNILVTGGAGSLGRALIKRLLNFNPKTIRVFDFDENGLFEVEQLFSNKNNLRFLLGDVRDFKRLDMALQGINIIFHLAALKHVLSSEFNPFEAVKTNIVGTQNVINAALKNNVEMVIYTSSDKAVNPTTVMGSSKLMAERQVVAANYYKGDKATKFSSVRFGNVVGTRGSVLPLWKNQIKQNEITLTDGDMTRFMMDQQEAIDLLIQSSRLCQGGEIFVMKMLSIKIGDLAKTFVETFNPKANIKIIGSKPGEKPYEELMTELESQRAVETDKLFIIPSHVEDFFSTQTHYYLGSKKTEIKNYNSHHELPAEKNVIKNLILQEEL